MVLSGLCILFSQVSLEGFFFWGGGGGSFHPTFGFFYTVSINGPSLQIVEDVGEIFLIAPDSSDAYHTSDNKRSRLLVKI